MENYERSDWEAKLNKSSLLQKISVEKSDIIDQEKIVAKFNQFLVNVGAILAKQIPESENTLQSCLVKTSAIMQHKSVSINKSMS